MQKDLYFMTSEIENLIHKLDNQAYFVGGCVRHFLKNQPINEIDMATPFTPDEVKNKLQNTDIKIIPTGIEHGTLTLLFKDKSQVELTSFRTDEKTDGRHALVAFGKSMRVDALRRDLTFNALYMDKQGQIFDFTNGKKDLHRGIVRFIGEAEKRITEDSLRILRFFRFWGVYSLHQPDKQAIKACRHQKKLLLKLSKERIYSEMMKIFTLPTPYKTLCLMQKTGVLRAVLQSPFRFCLLKHLLRQEKKTGFQTPALFRFWTLCPHTHLILSRKEKKRFSLWQKAFEEPLKTEQDFKKMLFFYGKEVFFCMILLKKKRISFNAFSTLTHIKEPLIPWKIIDLIDRFHLQDKQICLKQQQAIDVWIKMNFPSKKDIVFNAILE